MRRILSLCGFLALLCAVSSARAGDFWHPDEQCYWCIRDAIYHDVKLINHLQANPDVDEAVKGPQILAARADIYRLRVLLGPRQDSGLEPCCYARRPLHIR
jgi:hypothetical protein